MSGRHLKNLILPVSLQKECMPVHVKKFSEYFKKMKDANILGTANFTSRIDFTFSELLCRVASQKNESCMSVKFLPFSPWIQPS